MRGSLTLSSRAAAVELLPRTYFEPLDLAAVFPRAAPLEIDLGCGDGTFLTELAKQNPARNFLGIERLLGRVRSACRKAAHEKLENVRVVRVEIGYAVRYLLPPASVEVFHLLFPDPWPKKRHHRRRIVTEEFLRFIHIALAVDGVLRIATDQADYLGQILQLSATHAGLTVARSLPDDGLPPSTFEKHFKVAGVEVYWLELRKTSPVM